MRFHSSCLFDTGQPLLVDFGLCASTRLVFLTLVSRCWWTLACALPLVLSFSHWSATVGGLWLVFEPVKTDVPGHISWENWFDSNVPESGDVYALLTF